MKRFEELTSRNFESIDIYFNNSAKDLPSNYIPEVMPSKNQRKEAISLIKLANVPIIAISLQNFFYGLNENPLLRQARKKGLHNFLKYQGKIMLTTDVKDRLCDHFVQNPKYFNSLVQQLNPDYLTTFDTYTYSNIPTGIARIKMLEVVSVLEHLLDLDCKIIGLSLGAIPEQVMAYTELLKNIGCKIIAHPVYEFRKFADINSIRWRLASSKKLGLKTLLLSCTPGFYSARKLYSDYYSSWSWFSSISSKDGLAYTKCEKKLNKILNLSKNCSQQVTFGDNLIGCWKR